jgi:uncharacterized protein YfdQ (DUF2303 family)
MLSLRISGTIKELKRLQNKIGIGCRLYLNADNKTARIYLNINTTEIDKLFM